MSGNKKYIPVESNPEVFNSYASKLGVNVAQHAFCDVFGLDEELLAMVPQPVLAVLMLFPVTDASEKAKAEEDVRLKAGRGPKQEAAERDLYFMRQTISNACGTIALLHAVGNNTDELSIGAGLPAASLSADCVVSACDRGSFFEDFFRQTGDMDPEARAAFLESPPAGAPDIEKAHEEAARDGVTAPPTEDEEVNLHYAVFTLRDGHMWELDGRKSFPVDHGPSSRDALLQDAVAAVRQFIATTDSIRFNLMALTMPQVFG